MFDIAKAKLKLKKLNTSFSKQKIKCKRCNKEFTPIKGQLYCSKECVRLHKNETRHKHTKIKSQQTKNSTYIQSTIIHKNFQYNGVFISLQNSGNAFSWNAYKNNKLILKSASTFTSVMECIRDAKRAF